MADDFIGKNIIMNVEVTGIEEKDILLRLESGETLRWPKEKSIHDIRVGSRLELSLNLRGGERENIAKAVLNEIISGK